MKSNATLSTYLLCLFLMFSFRGSAQPDFQHEKDSLSAIIGTLEGEKKLDAHFELMLSVYHNEENMDTVARYFHDFIQEARLQQDLRTEGMVYVNLLAAYCNRVQMKEAIRETPGILEFLAANEQWEYYYQAYAIYLEACFFDKQYQKAIDEAKELYEFARKQGNDNGISAACYSMALVYNKTRRPRDAEEYFRKCIQIQQSLKNKTPLLTQSYYFLFEILSGEKRMDESQRLIGDWKKAIKDYEVSKELENPIAWGQVHTAYARICYDKGLLTEAEAYCDSSLMVLSDPSGVANASFLKALILSSKKEYDRALQLLDEAYTIYSDFNEWDLTYEVMKAKMEILLERKGMTEELSLFDALLARKDSITDTEFQAQLDELRTQYEVDKYIAEKEKTRTYLYFAVVLCLLLLAALGIRIYYNRQITKKNKTLVTQIKELQIQYGKVEAELLSRTSFETEETKDDLCPETRKDQLCLAIRDILLKEKAYRQPGLSRDGLTERLGTNKELFIDAFQYCFGMSFSEYISFLRLKDSLTLLEDSDLSIEEISEKVGFGTVRTFQRQFQNKYNMSPKEYRKGVKNEE